MLDLSLVGWVSVSPYPRRLRAVARAQVGYPPFYSDDPMTTCRKIVNWRTCLKFPPEVPAQSAARRPPPAARACAGRRCRQPESRPWRLVPTCAWECRQSVGVTCGSRRELSLKGA